MRSLIASALFVALAAPLHAQSAEDGEKVFGKCKSCHQVGEGAKNRTGPVLTGVVGRPAASMEGFKYSKSLAKAGEDGLVWDAATLDEWLTDPSKFLKARLGDKKAKAKMTFKLKDAENRAAVIAYLGTFSTASMEVPENGFCVINASETSHVFITETREGERMLAELAVGEQLCSTATKAEDGIVSVFESADALEGCSRIIPTGSAEELIEYAEFDRCAWGSHNS